jgi:VWFA-related protein
MEIYAMRIRGLVGIAGLILAGAALAQDPPANVPPPPQAEATIKTETRLVLVDVVVTDKKGNYINDLALKDFKVWEDNKEQSLKTFQFGADATSAARDKKKYMVLFFDNQHMDISDQQHARQEAGKFIDKNAGPDRLMAIVNFTGSLQVSQNFTEDAERLKKVVSGTRISVGASESGTGTLGSGGVFSVSTTLMAMRQLAKNMSDVPGRKIMIMFTAGFPTRPETQPEVTAAIDACNRANVSVYPVDVRGLFVPGNNGLPFGTPRGAAVLPMALRNAGIALASDPLLWMASFLNAYLPEQG